MSCNYQGIIWALARSNNSLNKPYAKTVKQSPEWLKNYENVEEPKKEELTPEGSRKGNGEVKSEV